MRGGRAIVAFGQILFPLVVSSLDEVADECHSLVHLVPKAWLGHPTVVLELLDAGWPPLLGYGASSTANDLALEGLNVLDVAKGLLHGADLMQDYPKGISVGTQTVWIRKGDLGGHLR